MGVWINDRSTGNQMGVIQRIRGEICVRQCAVTGRKEKRSNEQADANQDVGISLHNWSIFAGNNYQKCPKLYPSYTKIVIFAKNTTKFHKNADISLQNANRNGAYGEDHCNQVFRNGMRRSEVFWGTLYSEKMDSMGQT